jgi:hypothetical protein
MLKKAMINLINIIISDFNWIDLTCFINGDLNFIYVIIVNEAKKDPRKKGNMMKNRNKLEQLKEGLETLKTMDEVRWHHSFKKVVETF